MSSATLVVLTPEAAAALEQRAVWNGLAIGAAFLLAIALLAFRRSRTPNPPMHLRPRRIVETAGLWSLAYTAMQAPARSFGSGGPIDLLLGIASFMVLALALIGAADFLLDAVAPRRTLVWLVLGPLILGGFSIGLLALSQWMDIFRAEPGWREVMLAWALLIASIGWWSRLPSWDAAANDIFD
jgi:hypothetical protein